MGRKRKQRRQPHGSAWHWKQTDCWYYTQPGTKERVPLLDEDGKRIRGQDNRQAAELALARVKVAGHWYPTPEPASKGEWLVARVCSQYIEHCQRGVARGAISEGYRDDVVRYLDSLCDYCGALPTSQLEGGHVRHWVEAQPTWRSRATQRNAITVVLAAFSLGRNPGLRVHREAHVVVLFKRGALPDVESFQMSASPSQAPDGRHCLPRAGEALLAEWRVQGHRARPWFQSVT